VQFTLSCPFLSACLAVLTLFCLTFHCTSTFVVNWLNVYINMVLVHGQVTIIFVVSVCLFVQFFSAVFDCCAKNIVE